MTALVPDRQRRPCIALGLIVAAAAPAVLCLLATSSVRAFPLSGDQSVLPAQTELNEDLFERPREVFKSEANGGVTSYQVTTGDMAFSSPSILGATAQRAQLSCGTCHIRGTSNAKLFIPGSSTRAGNFDTTGHLFNPGTDNGVLDPLTTPSLRGARYLGPYGHDGRNASLREFVRSVIVNEFAGAEPSPLILDSLVAYIQDIDFLPNSQLGAGGRLKPNASAAAQRGELLFFKPFPHDPALSCAVCHRPTSAFVDHLVHDVGTNGLFKTPTLLNANFNAPYFHDARFDGYEEVVAYFNHFYDLRLSPQERRDLTAYLGAIGDGEQPYESDSVHVRLGEIGRFATLLSRALSARDLQVVTLSADTLGTELRELTEQFPDNKATIVSGGKTERRKARAALKQLVLCSSQIGMLAAAARFDSASAEAAELHRQLEAAAVLLRAAEPWSLFDRGVRDRYYSALRQMLHPPSASGR